MANVVRVFFALWYLGGWLIHLYLGSANGEGYRVFGDTMLVPGGRDVWQVVVMPHIRFFTLLLAAFELTTGLLIVGRGRAVQLGVAASMLFNLFLLNMGFGTPQPDWLSDFLNNRLLTIVFAAGQVPLLFMRFDESVWRALRRRLHRPSLHAAM